MLQRFSFLRMFVLQLLKGIEFLPQTQIFYSPSSLTFEIVGKVIFWCPIDLLFSNTLFCKHSFSRHFFKASLFPTTSQYWPRSRCKRGFNIIQHKIESLSHKLWSSYLYVFEEQWRRPFKFKTMNSVWSNSLALEYHPSTIRLQRYSDLKFNFMALSSI